MGVGVFFDNEGLTIIFDPLSDLETDCEFEYRNAWYDFNYLIMHSLPDGWETDIANPEWSEAGQEIAYNGLYSLYIKECESGNGNMYLTIRARESVKQDYFNMTNNTLNIAIANIHKAMNRIARSLQGVSGGIRVRTSGWTSGPWQPFEPVTFKACHL